MRIFSFSPFGYEGSLVSVEVDLRRGIPAVDVVGLADGTVKESRERMQAAIRNSSLDFPLERVLISLSPADLKKEGAGFDLPIALGVLCAQKEKNMEGSKEGNYPEGMEKIPNPEEDILVMGELELSGRIRPVKAIHAAASTAASAGIFKCIVPAANAQEAREVKGMKAFGADNLTDAFRALYNPESFSASSKKYDSMLDEVENSENINGVLFPKLQNGYEYAEIKGQKKLLRALQIAAAGGHNLLAVGAPGCGKTLSIQKFPGLLPLLTPEEAQSVTRILSLAGLLPPSEPLVRTVQFRMPHQTASIEGICGGGTSCRPGEISLAHNGVLFLDEAAEFKSSVLQMLRVPIENGRITLSRAGRSTVYPAQFQLMMAANPCPCGNNGSKSKICLCSERSIEQYWKKFSSPLLDRIDLRVFVDSENDTENLDETKPVERKNINFESALEENQTEEKCSEKYPSTTDRNDGNYRNKSWSTAEMRQDIARAVLTQRNRQGKKNSRLTPEEVSLYCKLSEESQTLLEKAVIRYDLSPRAQAACIKIARTIADLEGNPDIEIEHIQEAIDYRKDFSSFMNLKE